MQLFKNQPQNFSYVDAISSQLESFEMQVHTPLLSYKITSYHAAGVATDVATLSDKLGVTVQRKSCET